MDSRKTLVMADFDRVVRAVQEAAGAEPEAAAPQNTQPTAARSSVIIGRTVVAGSDSSLARTQVWRDASTLDRTIETDDTGERERAEVRVESSVMHHLSAEVWAGQRSHDSHLRVTTVRQSLLDVPAEVVDVRETVPSTMIVKRGGRAPQERTEVLARVIREYSEIRIPRLFRMPSAKTIRVWCLGLCMASAAAIAIWPPAIGKSSGTVKSSAVAVESSWPAAAPRPAAPQPAATPRPPTSGVGAPPLMAAAQVVERPASTSPSSTPNARPEPRTATVVGTTSRATPAPGGIAPRAAVDALIAGKQDVALSRYRALAKSRPSDPVYATAAQILEDAMKRGDDAP